MNSFGGADMTRFANSQEKVSLALLFLYWTAAAGYGGWCGRDWWRGGGVWWLLIPTFAYLLLNGVREWRRNPYSSTIKIQLMFAPAVVITFGGTALAIAWLCAEGTDRVSSKPASRAIISAVGVAITLGLVVALRPPKLIEPRDANDPETTNMNTEPIDGQPLK